MELLPKHQPLKRIVRLCCVITIILYLFNSFMQSFDNVPMEDRKNYPAAFVLAIIGLILSLRKDKPKPQIENTTKGLKESVMSGEIVKLKLKSQNDEQQVQGVGEVEGAYLVIRKDGKENGRYPMDSIQHWSNQPKPSEPDSHE